MAHLHNVFWSFCALLFPIFVMAQLPHLKIFVGNGDKQAYSIRMYCYDTKDSIVPLGYGIQEGQQQNALIKFENGVDKCKSENLFVKLKKIDDNYMKIFDRLYSATGKGIGIAPTEIKMNLEAGNVLSSLKADKDKRSSVPGKDQSSTGNEDQRSDEECFKDQRSFSPYEELSSLPKLPEFGQNSKEFGWIRIDKNGEEEKEEITTVNGKTLRRRRAKQRRKEKERTRKFESEWEMMESGTEAEETTKDNGEKGKTEEKKKEGKLYELNLLNLYRIDALVLAGNDGIIDFKVKVRNDQGILNYHRVLIYCHKKLPEGVKNKKLELVEERALVIFANVPKRPVDNPIEGMKLENLNELEHCEMAEVYINIEMLDGAGGEASRRIMKVFPLEIFEHAIEDGSVTIKL